MSTSSARQVATAGLTSCPSSCSCSCHTPSSVALAAKVFVNAARNLHACARRHHTLNQHHMLSWQHGPAKKHGHGHALVV
jgi:hypothetical protein